MWGEQKGGSCVHRGWVSSLALEQSGDPHRPLAFGAACHAEVPQALPGFLQQPWLLASAGARGSLRSRSWVSQGLLPAVPRLSNLLKVRARSRSAGGCTRQLSAVPLRCQHSPPRPVKNNGQGADKTWAIELFPRPARLNIIIPTLQMDCISSAEIWKE